MIWRMSVLELRQGFAAVSCALVVVLVLQCRYLGPGGMSGAAAGRS